MNVRQPDMGKSRSIDDLYRLRLVALLDDLVGDNAASRSTADLDADHGTLTVSPGSERLTRKVRVALADNQGQAELPGNAAPAAAGAEFGNVAKVAATDVRRFPVGFRKLH